ncbi:bile acid:sodium symporter family protein [Thermostilla marina]
MTTQPFIDRFFTGLRSVLEKGLLVWLVLLCLTAFVWPNLIGTTTFDPFVQGKTSLPYWIAVTMLAIGSLLPPEEVRGVLRRWPRILGGTTTQYLSMPLLAYVCGRAFGLEGPWLIGILMAGCVPGAMASNVLTLLARGNVSYSVGLTTSATLLSPAVVPAVMYLTVGRVTTFPVGKTAFDLAWMVVAPVVTGYVLSRIWPLWEKWADRLGAIVANVTILWIIAVVVGVNRQNMQAVTGTLAAALLTLNGAGYLAGFLAGGVMRLDQGMRRALTLEVGMQNAGLGTTLALGLFPDQPQVAIPCALYTFGCMFTGSVLARVWSAIPVTNPTEASTEAAETA